MDEYLYQELTSKILKAFYKVIILCDFDFLKTSYKLMPIKIEKTIKNKLKQNLFSLLN